MPLFAKPVAKQQRQNQQIQLEWESSIKPQAGAWKRGEAFKAKRVPCAALPQAGRPRRRRVGHGCGGQPLRPLQGSIFWAVPRQLLAPGAGQRGDGGPAVHLCTPAPGCSQGRRQGRECAAVGPGVWAESLAGACTGAVPSFSALQSHGRGLPTHHPSLIPRGEARAGGREEYLKEV